MNPIEKALRKHSKYVKSLDRLERWMKRHDNAQKVQLLLLIRSMVEQKRKGFDPDDVLIPNVVDLLYSLDEEKIKRFRKGRVPESLVEEAPQFIHYLRGYENMLISIEVRASELIEYISGVDFLSEFNIQDFEVQVDIMNSLVYRLSGSQNGRGFILKSISTPCVLESNTSGEIDPVFSLCRIDGALEYLLIQKRKDGSSRLASKVKLANDILEYCVEVSPFLFNSKLGSFFKASRKIVHKSISEALNFLDDKLDDLSDFIDENTPFGDPDLDDLIFENENLKEYIKGVKKYFKENELKIKKGAVNSLKVAKGIIGIWQVGLASMNSLNNPSVKSTAELSAALAETAGAINDIPKFKFAKDGTKIASGLSKVLIVAGIIGVILSVLDARDAVDSEDYSVAVGHSFSAASAAAGVMAIIYAGAATAWTGIGLLLLVVGLLLIYLTGDERTEVWFTRNYFGRLWNEVESNTDSLGPEDLTFKFTQSIERQIIKFHSILHPPNITSVSLDTIGSDVIDYINQYPSSLNLEFLNELGKMGSVEFMNDFYELTIEMQDSGIISDVFNSTLYLWDDTKGEFVWDSSGASILAKPTSSSIVIPRYWEDENIFFYKQELLLSRENGVVSSIDKYVLKFFMRKTFIEPNADENFIFSHIELRFNLWMGSDLNKGNGLVVLEGANVNLPGWLQ